jgi:hypothetical protein
MKDELLVNRYMIMTFDQGADSLVQFSVSLSLESCRILIKSLREKYPNEEFSIVAVLDE